MIRKGGDVWYFSQILIKDFALMQVFVNENIT